MWLFIWIVEMRQCYQMCIKRIIYMLSIKELNKIKLTETNYIILFVWNKDVRTDISTMYS